MSFIWISPIHKGHLKAGRGLKKVEEGWGKRQFVSRVEEMKKRVGGHVHMTSTWGAEKNDSNDRLCESDTDKGGGVQAPENFMDII